jgi:hypothetical protein
MKVNAYRILPRITDVDCPPTNISKIIHSKLTTHYIPRPLAADHHCKQIHNERTSKNKLTIVWQDYIY